MTLGLGGRQEPPQTVGMLAQLHGVDGQAAGLRGDVQHGGGSRALGRGLVQRRVLHLHRAELSLEQFKGTAAGGNPGRPGNLTPVSHHDGRI